jgi:hypothetical protein
MGEPVPLQKAQLIELDASFSRPLPGGRAVRVQFNPESLKVTFANRVEQPQTAGDQRGNAARQVPAAGATKLTLQLWFDVTAPGASGSRDVRSLTRQVVYFMTPKAPPGGSSGSGTQQPVPPGVRFLWGTFQFDGMMDSLEETLDFFSPDGRPLRAAVALSLSGQVALTDAGAGAGGAGSATAGPTAGTTPLAQARSGSTLQDMAAAAGVGLSWQSVAAANGIENPRLLPPGQLVDFSLRASGGVSRLGVRSPSA